MLCHKLNYCSLDQLMTVINYLEITETDDGVLVRYSFPEILLWSGDHFGYVDQIRIKELVTARSRAKATEKIRQRMNVIFTWEHRKAYDGIRPVIPDDCLSS